MDYGTGIACRLDYIRSVPGVLKLIELLCDLLAVILCGAAPLVDGGSGQKGFFLFVSILALIVTTILFILFVLNINNMLLKNRWPLIEMCWCAFIALFYFIASIVIATIAKQNGTYGAAAFFGFAAFITYVADAIFQFRTNRSSSYAHNEQQYGQQYGQQQPGQQYGQQGQQYGPNPTAQRQQPTY